MPKSRSRRKPSRSRQAKQAPKPPPSPRWVPVVGLSAIGGGLLLILVNYLVPGLPGGNLNLIVGFAIMAVGLVLLSRWR